MTPPKRVAGATISLRAGTVEVCFVRAGDRWLHVVSAAGTIALESVEAGGDLDADPRWPASPALTEVTRLDAAGRPAILGLGLAGRSHFSVSISAHPDRPDTLLFEVACRVQEPPAWLGSTYRAADGSLVRTPAPTAGAELPCTVQWAYAIGPGGLMPLPTAAGPRRP